MFTKEQIIDLKQKLDIKEFYSQFLALKETGKYYRATCCFHPDGHPSLDVDKETGLFICRSCGASGDIIDFYMRYNNKNFSDAVMEIAKSQGIEIKISEEVRKEYELKERLYKINNFVATKFQKSLLTSDVGKEYVKTRQFTVDTIKKFKIGYIPQTKLFSNNDATNNLLKTCGLIRQNEDGEYRNYFGSYRISIPFFDEHNRIVGFSSRAVNNNIKPKYLHSQINTIFKKDEILYGYNFAKDKIKESKCVLMVEGQVDCIMAHQFGITNTIATCGLNLSDKQISLLKKVNTKYYFLIVEDEKGENAVDRLYDTIIQNDFYAIVKIVRLYDEPDEKMDLDEFLRTKGKGALFEKLKHSKVYYEDKLVNSLKNMNYKTIDEKKFHIYNVRKYIAKITNPIDRKQYIQLLADKLELPEIDVRKVVDKAVNCEDSISVGEYDNRIEVSQQTILASLFSKFGIQTTYDMIKELKVDKKMLNIYRKIFEKIEMTLLNYGVNCDLINILYSSDIMDKDELRILDKSYFLSEQFDNLDDEEELRECLKDQLNNLK